MALDAIEQLQQKLRRLPDQVDGMMQRITERNKAIIEDKVIAQMQAGLNSDGQPITPAYSPFTVAYKKSIGAAFDRVTLEGDGDFYKGEKVEVHAEGFQTTNTDRKWGKLTEKYGDVTDLSPKSTEELREEVYLPELHEEINDYMDHG